MVKASALHFEEVTPAEIIEGDTDIQVTYNPASISADFDALENSIKMMVAPFSGVTVSPETLKDEKKVRAYLRSISKDLNDRRKTIKNTYMEPYNRFEARVKQIDRIITDEVENIDTQIKAIEAEERRSRRDALQTIYEEAAPALVPVIGFDRIVEEGWLLKSMSPKKAEDALLDKVDRIASEWMTFQKLDLDHKDQAEIVFFRELSLKAAIDEHDRIVAEKERIDQMRSIVVPDIHLEEQVTDEPEVLQVQPQVVDTPMEQPYRYLRLSVGDIPAVVAFCKANGIHGDIVMEARNA